jgi:hypothetical protein
LGNGTCLWVDENQSFQFLSHFCACSRCVRSSIQSKCLRLYSLVGNPMKVRVSNLTIVSGVLLISGKGGVTPAKAASTRQ